MVLSIVIPLGPYEKKYEQLLGDLEIIAAQIKISFEILLVAPKELKLKKHYSYKITYLLSPIGRGPQMNYGAENAKGDFICFLHADSQIKLDDFNFLLISLEKYPNDLHYFDLQFSCRQMLLNQMGAKFRSDILGIPFGDQGLAMKRQQFKLLGGFTHELGEDHHFVWKARLAGVHLRNNGGTLVTSPRKYQENGWARTTARHLVLTFKQAFPYFLKLLKINFF
jgi:glycosyltransferase involved in cell wall biosynthesis